ncbi:LOW QUALITY PROTEIN: TBC1 domain family member 10B [Pelodiscus sinensis]|uniref:LOW QUALITY PROTEIN: TBC1 domain family member 10B n=1 Tax=Pelodiscus sinensis TaxID=13735 RepID=UPI003F6D5472
MEMGAGDAPSPPPRYNAPRSALYTARLGAKATPTAPSPGPPARPLGSPTGTSPGIATATGGVGTSLGIATATGGVGTSPGIAAATGGVGTSPGIAAATGGVGTSPGIAAATGGVGTSPGSAAATGGVGTSPGSAAATSGVGTSPGIAAATGGVGTSPGSAAATGGVGTSPGIAVATGGVGTSPGIAAATGGVGTSPGSAAATGGVGTSLGRATAVTGQRVTSPGSTVVAGSVGTCPGSAVVADGVGMSPVTTGSVAASPGSTTVFLVVTDGVSASPGSITASPAAAGGVAASAGSARAFPATTDGVGTSPAVPGGVAVSPGSATVSLTATGNVVASPAAPASPANLRPSPAPTGSAAAVVDSEGPCVVTTGNMTAPVASPVATTPGATMAAAAVQVVLVSTETTQLAGADATTTPPAAAPSGSLTMPNSLAAGKAAPPVPVKPLPAPFPSPAVVVEAPSPVVQEKSSPPATEVPAPLDPAVCQDMGSQSSLGPGIPPPRPPPAPDTLSYLDSVSLMSGTLESLTGPGFPDDASSLGSDSEINGLPYRRTDKYGFLGGSQYSGMPESGIPVDVARQRELKWLDMFSHWDKWLSRRFQKVKLRCRKGIPSSLRAKAWQLLSNSKELLEQNADRFEELERQPGDPKWLDVIEKDLHRQFPFHEMFAARGGHGQQDLYRILKAYTIYRPDEGYCQAQAPVAAVLLMHMPAEQAFWCLVQICEKYLPGYYSAGLEAIQLDGEIFFALLRRASPIAYRHLKKYKIDPILYMTEWFMCIFSRTLPWGSVLRIWDMFFCEGVKIIFRVGLVLLQNTLGSVDKLRSCQGMYETMEKLRNLPAQSMQEEFLVSEVVNLPVTEALIERENAAQLKKWRENRGELQYKPSRRLHGSRAIHEERHRMNPPLSASASLLSLTGIKQRVARGSSSSSATGGSPSPAHPVSSLAVSAAPPPAATPGPVVSEGLHPALPSPTGSSTPLGAPRKGAKEKKRERERERLEKERERQERERERQEREREKKLQKEREKQERKQQKERAKEEAKQKKERKVSMRRKESKAPPPTEDGGQEGDPPAGSVLQDTYF